MTVRRLIGVLVLLLVGVGAAIAQQEITRLQNVEINRGFFRTGAGVALEMEGTTNDAFEYFIRSEPTEDVTWILPAAKGTAGTQLQTDGALAQSLSWASAGSLGAYKTIDGRMDPTEALTAIVRTPVYRFHYKKEAAEHTTRDFDTQYVGVKGEEAPWAMHHNGTILSEINTAGYAFAAIQAQQQQIEALKAEIAALRRR